MGKGVSGKGTNEKGRKGKNSEEEGAMRVKGSKKEGVNEYRE